MGMRSILATSLEQLEVDMRARGMSEYVMSGLKEAYIKEGILRNHYLKQEFDSAEKLARELIDKFGFAVPYARSVLAKIYVGRRDFGQAENLVLEHFRQKGLTGSSNYSFLDLHLAIDLSEACLFGRNIGGFNSSTVTCQDLANSFNSSLSLEDRVAANKIDVSELAWSGYNAALVRLVSLYFRPIPDLSKTYLQKLSENGVDHPVLDVMSAFLLYDEGEKSALDCYMLAAEHARSIHDEDTEKLAMLGYFVASIYLEVEPFDNILRKIKKTFGSINIPEINLIIGQYYATSGKKEKGFSLIADSFDKTHSVSKSFREIGIDYDGVLNFSIFNAFDVMRILARTKYEVSKSQSSEEERNVLVNGALFDHLFMLQFFPDAYAYNSLRLVIGERIREEGKVPTYKRLSDILAKHPDIAGVDYAIFDLFLDSESEFPQEILNDVFSYQIEQHGFVKTTNPLSSESLNEVFVSGAGLFSSSLLVFKSPSERSDEAHDRLFRDFIISRVVCSELEKDPLNEKKASDIYGNLIVKPFQPITLCEDQSGKSYLVSRRVNSPNLSSAIGLFNAKDINDALGHAVSTLAKIHVLMTRLVHSDSGRYHVDFKFEADESGESHQLVLSPYKPREELERRLIKRQTYDDFPRLESLVDCGSSSMKDFMIQYDRLAEKIKSGPFVFMHGDAHLGNFLTNGTLLDFERACIGNPMADLADVLLKMEDPDDSLLKKYLDQFKLYLIFNDCDFNFMNLEDYFSTPSFTPDLSRFKESLLFCRIQKSLCMLGTSLRRNLRKEAWYYLLRLSNDFMPQIPELNETFLNLFSQNSDRVKKYFSS